MTATATVAMPIPFAEGAEPVGYVLEKDALWFRRPRGESWHLMAPTGLKSWCGLRYGPKDATRVIHVTWPWPDRGCWSCMDRRWSRGVR